MGADDMITLAAYAGVAALAYYLHTKGTFDEIFDAISKALDDIKNTKTKSEEEAPQTQAAFTEPYYPYTYSYVGQAGPHRAYKSRIY